MSQVESAVNYFKEGLICSQAVLLTYGTQLGLNHETALKIADGFGGGMGRMGEICGAVTGAFMVIGLKHGQIAVEDTQSHEKTYKLINEFVSAFKSRNESIICRDLINCDISTPEGLNLAREKQLFNAICPKYVRDAAEIIEQLLE